jgi:LPXTG-motif cell wall-anchored protein
MTTRTTTMALGVGAALAGAVALTVAALGLAGTASGQQPNRGTVKIDGTDLADVPNNEPHVDDCVFNVEFFGYPANQEVAVQVTLQSPTSGPGAINQSTVLDDDDESGGGSAEGFDGQITIDATSLTAGIEPHPIQGWHLRLEVDDGEVGGPKQKVFWVIGCEEPPPTTGTTSTTSTTSTTVPDTTTTTAPDETTTTTAGPTRDGGPPTPGQPGAPAAPAAPQPVTELALTGSSSWVLTIVGSLLVLVGAGLTLVSRRRLAA